MPKTYLVETTAILRRHYIVEADEPPMTETAIETAYATHWEKVSEEIEKVSEMEKLK